MSEKIVVFGSLAPSLTNFRYPLLKAMVESGYDVIACAPDADETVISKLAEISVGYENIALARTGLNPFLDIKNLYKMYKSFKRIKPDYILSYTLKPTVYGSIAAHFAGVRNIYSMITGLGYAFTSNTSKSKVVNNIVTGLLRRALKYNRKVFFQNPDDINLFKQKNILREPDQAFMINGSGVDLNHYRREPLPKENAFLFIGRLIVDKGIVEYAEAARLVRRKYPQIKFYVAGWIDTNPSAISQSVLDSWIDDESIEFLGRLSDVRPAISLSSVYVLPSYREGTPRTVLEAMAMGRAIITTDAPGCRETVTHGLNGFLVPIKSVEALAEKMVELIENPETLVNMGEESYKIAVDKYDVYKVNTSIMQMMRLI